MLNKSDELQVGNVSDNSVVNQANGNIYNISNSNNGLQIGDVVPLVQALVKSELEVCKLQAENTVLRRFNEFTTSLESELEKKVSDKISRFAEPAMQFATREATVGYLKSGDPVEGEALIDLLIERVKEKERTSKQSLIDEAIRTLPKLSRENIAVLTLITYAKLYVEGNVQALDNWIKCLNPILDIFPQINRLDIEYLVQADCVSALALAQREDWIEQNRKNYPLAFVSPIDASIAKAFMEKYGINREGNAITLSTYFKTVDQCITLFQIFKFNEDGTIVPLLLKQDNYANILQKAGLGSMQADIEKLLSNAETMSNEKISSYYKKFHPNWSVAIKLLNERPINSFNLKPVGAYIGSRQLTKLYGKEVDLNLFFK
ncbi:MAG: LPO_1073/Vpar_1526 family protein [Candidatus Limimorpha sp.]